jgi:hypothetical protein
MASFIDNSICGGQSEGLGAMEPSWEEPKNPTRIEGRQEDRADGSMLTDLEQLGILGRSHNL